MTDMHEPDPDFARFLEWQTRTELRRRERFGAPEAVEPPAPVVARRRQRVWPRLARAAAVVLLSVSAGASAVLAAQGVERSRGAERLLAANRIELTLAERRVEAAEQALALTEARVRTASAPPIALEEQALRVAGAAVERRRLAIDREEIELTSGAPDDSIAGPVFAGRDFVRERLLLDVERATAEADFAEKRRAIAQAHVDMGMAPLAELRDAQTVASLAARRVELAAGAVELRARYARGELEAAEALRLHELARVEGAIAATRLTRDALTESIAVLKERLRLGQATGAQLTPLETELLELDARLELLALEAELHGRR